MFSKLFSELITLVLVIIVSSRFFFINKIHHDRLSAVAVLILPLALINVLSWGFGIVEDFLLILSVIVFFANIRSFGRLRHKLALDHFSLGFIISSALCILLSLAAGVLLVIRRPISENLAKQNVFKETNYYIGNFHDGFKKTSTPFILRNAVVTEYSYHMEQMEEVPEELIQQINQQRIAKNATEPLIKEQKKVAIEPPATTNADGKRKIVILLPNKSAGTEDYIPLIKGLVAQGYTVYAGEFYTKDHKWFADPLNLRLFRKHIFLYRKIFNLNVEVNDKQLYYEDELRSLLNLVQAERSDTVFLLGDQDSAEALKSTHETFFDLVDSWMDLAEVNSYQTKGYGFVNHTNPLLASYLGLQTQDQTLLASEISASLISEMEFQGQLNTFALEQRENNYSTDSSPQPATEIFPSETADTLQIQETELQLE